MKGRKRETVGTAVLAAAIIGIYVFLCGGYDKQPYGFSRDSLRYYHLLVDGFLAGRTSLLLEPPPELAKMADPYDPVQRGEFGLHDGTYYKGKYYLYFGVGPAIALFLPFRLLTGVHFSENLAVGLFCAGGFLSSLALFLGLRRRFFPGVTSGWVHWATLMLGVANFCPVMLVRSDFWEVPIAGAFFFSCFGLLALWRGLGGNAGADRRWLWLSSAAFGLGVACRPHLIFAAAVLGFVWLWRQRDLRSAREPERRAGGDRDALALFLPLTVVTIALLAYNYARFGDPLEFGQKYQIGGVSMRHFAVMNPKFIPINFYFNFLAPAQFQRYFPFVEVISGYRGSEPVNYLGHENPYGVLPNLPVVWLMALAPAAWWAARRTAPLGRWLIILGWHAAAIAGMVLLFGGATNRYLVDFLPSFLLLAGLGILALGEFCRTRVRARWLALAAVGALVGYSSGFTLLAAVQYNGLFRLQHPALYASLARWGNAPVYAWERWRGSEYGPLQVTMTFPKNQQGKPEPVLITGASYHSDYLYVVYDALGKSIQLAYDRTNYEHAVSQPIPVDYNLPHQIGIESGALYPPVEHPFFRNRPPAEVKRLKTTLRVTVDGVPYLVAEHPFFDATPGQVSIGQNHLSDNGGRKFTGRLGAAVRGPLPPAVEDFPGGGFLQLAVVFPSDAAGRSEPLVATGGPGQGDLLFVTYVDPTHVRLGFQQAGEAPRLSEPLDIAPGAIQLLEISLGSFYAHAATARQRELASTLAVQCNGRTVWLEPRTFAAAGAPPAIGVNAWGSDACTERFSGRIVGQRLAPAVASGPESAFAVEPYWMDAAGAPQWGPVRMRLKLPSGQTGKVEPLVVTGATPAQGDYLWINYPTETQVLIGYEHTGAGGPHTGLVTTDYAQPQVLEVSLPSLYPPRTDEYFAGRPLAEAFARTTQAQLRLNGTVRFDARVSGYESPRDKVTFGENLISEAFGKKFSGQILSVERGFLASPPGLDANLGDLELTLSWPASAAAGTREALLATGGIGRADALLLEYADTAHARFVARSADGKILEGKVVTLAPQGTHRVKIRWGGLFPEGLLGRLPAEKARQEARQAVAVSVDGQEVLAGQLEFQRIDPQPLWLGLGVKLGERDFSGRLHAVMRLRP